MRVAAPLFACLVVAVLSPAGLATTTPAPGASFSVESGRGAVTLTGKGVLLGHLDHGQLEITDLTPNDRFSPRVNGVPRGRLVTLRSKDVGFYVPGGRYRIVVHGEGISISTRGTGVVLLDGEPDSVGATGTFAVGDQPAQAVPVDLTKVTFGKGPDDPAAKSGTGSGRQQG